MASRGTSVVVAAPSASADVPDALVSSAVAAAPEPTCGCRFCPFASAVVDGTDVPEGASNCLFLTAARVEDDGRDVEGVDSDAPCMAAPSEASCGPCALKISGAELTA